MAKADLTAQRLRELFEYNDVSGVLRWRKGKVAGRVAGSITPKGYLKLKLGGTSYRVHRLIWCYMTGDWPDEHLHVDHIDGVRTNNAWENLRLITPALNLQNRRQNSGVGRSRMLGVSVTRYKSSTYFVANIRVDGVTKYLGSFRSEEAASAAYMKAKLTLHPGYVA